MDSAWGNERQRVTLALAPQDCWTSSELLYLQERISSFYGARKSQVVVVLTQNAATEVTHVVKLTGGGRNITYYCSEENIQEDSYTHQYMCLHTYVRVRFSNTHRAGPHSHFPA